MTTRLTRLGWGALFLAGLSAVSALSTGNNLLYLLWGMLLASLALSWLGGRANLRGIGVRPGFAERVFRGQAFTLRLALEASSRCSRAIWASAQGVSAGPADARPGAEAELSLRLALPHRGLNRVVLHLETLYPFGFMRHRRAVFIEALACPALRDVRSAAEISSDVEAAGRTLPRKGTGDELYGVREKDPSDDARLINWKLSARSGKLLVNEYAAAQASKVTVRLSGPGAGEGAEAAIAEAASACRYHIDAGAEVRVVTPEWTLDYGKGVLHLDRALRRLALLGEGKLPRDVPPGAAALPLATQGMGVRRLFFALSAVVYAALFLMEEISPRLLWRLAPVLPLGWLLTEFRGPRLPRSLWNAASVLVLLYIVVIDWRASGIVVANAHLVTYLLINRVLSELSDAELPQAFLILFLGFFLVSGLTISPWYFLCFMIYTGLSTAWLLRMSGLPWRGFAAWAPAGAGLYGAGLALTIAGFMLAPRVDRFRRLNPFVAMGIDKLQVQPASQIGFTENISLGFYGSLKKSMARVMRVKPVQPLAAGTHPAPLRLRGAAYDHFDGWRWRRSTVDFRFRMGERAYWSAAGKAWAPRREDHLFFPADLSARRVPAYEFTIYPMNLAVLFSVDGLWAVEGGLGAAYFDFTDTVHFSVPYMAGTQYRLHPVEGLGFSRAVMNYERILKEHYLQLPPGMDPHVETLARRITAKAADDAARVRVVEKYLRRHYDYSTYSEAKAKGLEDFLFRDQSGNCEYFATAAAILLRTLGIPARLATGFLAEEWNEFGGFYDVRQGQAHAWTEAYVGGRWVAFDPTPGGGGIVSRAMLHRLRKAYEAVEARWYRHVIGYDQYVQRNTFHRLGLGISRESLGRLAAGAAWGGAAAAAAWLAWTLWRSRRQARRRAKAGFFGRAEARLARAGLSRAPHLTPREFALEVVDRRPDLGAVAALAELHYLDRYDPRGLAPEDRRRAEELVGDIAARA